MKNQVQIKHRYLWQKLILAGSAALMMNVSNVNAQSMDTGQDNVQEVYSYDGGFYRDPGKFSTIEEALEYGRSHFDSGKHIEFYVNLDPEGYYVIDWEMKPMEDDGNEIPNDPIPNEPDQEPHIYTVQSGDSLWTIATHYGVTIEELIEWNQLEANFLYVGQELVVAAPDNETEDPEQPEEPKEDYRIHHVQEGEYLWLIATHYGVTVEELIEWNQLETNILNVGQELIVGFKL